MSAYDNIGAWTMTSEQACFLLLDRGLDKLRILDTFSRPLAVVMTPATYNQICTPVTMTLDDVIRDAVVQWNTLGPRKTTQSVSEFISVRVKSFLGVK